MRRCLGRPVCRRDAGVNRAAAAAAAADAAAAAAAAAADAAVADAILQVMSKLLRRMRMSSTAPLDRIASLGATSSAAHSVTRLRPPQLVTRDRAPGSSVHDVLARFWEDLVQVGRLLLAFLIPSCRGGIRAACSCCAGAQDGQGRRRRFDA